VSLEDKLMRLFNSDRIVKIMDKMGHQEGEVIQHSMITKSIERAQKKVEENNFGIRKRLLEYDDVMNIQRSAIYNKRNNALSGERLSVDLYNMIMSLTESLVDDHKAVGDYSSFKNDCLRVLSLEPNIDEASFNEGNTDQLVRQFQSQVLEAYEVKSEKISEVLLPVIKNVYENEGHRYKRIAVPYESASREKPLPIAADLKRAVDSEGKAIMKDIEKAVTLALIDENWKEHLRSMDELKDSVQSASFEQKDPLVIYKMEAYRAFEQLVYRINYDVISYLMGAKLNIGAPEDVKEAKSHKTDFRKVRTNKSEEARRRAAVNAGRQDQGKPETFKRVEKKVKRNDPCPCGSGKKYKQCHGK
jgi:preprotein translocase subunit SecA